MSNHPWPIPTYGPGDTVYLIPATEWENDRWVQPPPIKSRVSCVVLRDPEYLKGREIPLPLVSYIVIFTNPDQRGIGHNDAREEHMFPTEAEALAEMGRRDRNRKFDPIRGLQLFDLEMTCEACPSQWEATTNNNLDVYIRLRHGYFYVEVAGQRVFEDYPPGYDGVMTTGDMLAYTGMVRV